MAEAARPGGAYGASGAASGAVGDGAVLERAVVEAARRDRQARAALRESGGAAGRADHMTAVDRDHVPLVRRVLANLGWPTEPGWARSSIEAFWLLVQHCPDDELQERALVALRRACREGRGDPVQLAYLTDRVLVRRGEPQQYGTQVEVSRHGIRLLPVDDPDAVARRRRRAGLAPLEAYLADLTEHLRPLGPPR